MSEGIRDHEEVIDHHRRNKEAAAIVAAGELVVAGTLGGSAIIESSNGGSVLGTIIFAGFSIVCAKMGWSDLQDSLAQQNNQTQAEQEMSLLVNRTAGQQ